MTHCLMNGRLDISLLCPHGLGQPAMYTDTGSFCLQVRIVALLDYTELAGAFALKSVSYLQKCLMQAFHLDCDHEARVEIMRCK